MDPHTAIQVITQPVVEDPRQVQTLIDALSSLDNADPDIVSQLVSEQMVLHHLVGLLVKYSRNEAVLSRTMTVLKQFGGSSNPLEMVDADVIGRVVACVLAGNSGNPAVSRSAMVLLGRVADNAHMKMLVRNQQGLKAIVRVARDCDFDADALDDCFYALANLALDSPENVNDIVQEGAIPLIVKALEHHPRFTSLVESGLTALTNLCAGGNETRLLIAQHGAPSMLNSVLLQRNLQTHLVLSALQLAGALAYYGECVPPMVDVGFLETLVGVMKQHRSEEESLELAMHVLANMAAESPADSVSRMINGGALFSVVSVGSSFSDNVALQVAVLRALGNLTRFEGSSGSEAAGEMIRERCIPIVILALDRHRYEDQIIMLGLKVLKKLTANEVHLARMIELDVPRVLITLLDAQADKPDVRMANLGCICQMANAQTAQQLVNLGLLDRIHDVMAHHTEKEELVDAALQVAINLASNASKSGSGTAKAIAKKLTTPVIAASRLHRHSAPFINLVSAFFGNLIQHEGTIQHLLHHNLLRIYMDILMMKQHKSTPDLATKLINNINYMMDAQGYASKPSTTSVKNVKYELLLMGNVEEVIVELVKASPASSKLKKAAAVFVYKLKREEFDRREEQEDEREAMMQAAVRARERRRNLTTNRTRKNIGSTPATAGGGGTPGAGGAHGGPGSMAGGLSPGGGMDSDDDGGFSDDSDDPENDMSPEMLEQLSTIHIPTLDSQLKTFLQAGHVFRKHSRTAPPRERHIFVSPDLRFIVWRDPKKPRQKPRSMYVGHVRSVQKGLTTKSLQRDPNMMWRDARKAQAERSFSVSDDRRSLDLECETEAECDRWIEALEKLIEFQRQVDEMQRVEDGANLPGGGTAMPGVMAMGSAPSDYAHEEYDEGFRVTAR